MRICNVTSMHEVDDNRIFQRECRGLARLGHESYFVVTHNRAEARDGVTIVPLKRRQGLARRVLSSIEATLRARKLDADIYHFHDPDLLPWMAILAITGRTVVYDVHENYEARFYQWALPPWLRAPAARAFSIMERVLVGRLAAVTAVSESIRRKYEPFARAAHLLQNVPDFEMFNDIELWKDEKVPPVIITAGHLGPDRQCMETIEALPWILERRPETIARFLGRYPEGYRAQLWSKACALGVEGSVDLIGFMPVAEAYRAIAEAAVGCVFYEDNPNNRVALGNRIFEYMCCAVPVLAQDFPELRRLVESTGCGILVNSSSPRDIARGVLEIIEDPQRMKVLGMSGRRAVEKKYNLEMELAHVIDLFQGLLRGNSEPLEGATGGSGP